MNSHLSRDNVLEFRAPSGAAPPPPPPKPQPDPKRTPADGPLVGMEPIKVFGLFVVAFALWGTLMVVARVLLR